MLRKWRRGRSCGEPNRGDPWSAIKDEKDASPVKKKKTKQGLAGGPGPASPWWTLACSWSASPAPWPAGSWPSPSRRCPSGRCRPSSAATSWPRRSSGRASGWAASTRPPATCSARPTTPCWRCRRTSRRRAPSCAWPSSWAGSRAPCPAAAWSAPPVPATTAAPRRASRSRAASSSSSRACACSSPCPGRPTRSSRTSTTPTCPWCTSGSWARPSTWAGRPPSSWWSAAPCWAAPAPSWRGAGGTGGATSAGALPTRPPPPLTRRSPSHSAASRWRSTCRDGTLFGNLFWIRAFMKKIVWKTNPFSSVF